MTIYKIRDELLVEIAEAIREKLATNTYYYPTQFPELIRSIEAFSLRKIHITDVKLSRLNAETINDLTINDTNVIKLTSSQTEATKNEPVIKNVKNITSASVSVACVISEEE